MRALDRSGWRVADVYPSDPVGTSKVRKKSSNKRQPKKLSSEQIELFWKLRKQGPVLSEIASRMHVGIFRIYMEILT